MEKQRIAILMGGYDAEAEISMLSGEAVAAHIDRKKFVALTVHIGPTAWVVVDADATYEIDKGDFSYRKGGERCAFDAVFIAVHGKPGEDGTLQAYFDLIGMPYTGCSMQHAALTFNKYCCNHVLRTFGVPVPKSRLLNPRTAYSIDGLIDCLKLPLFVKPNKGGSSLGNTKVTERGALLAAINRAFVEDDEVIVEAVVRGKEFSVGALYYKGDVLVLPLTELVYEGVFDYAAKYEGRSQEITPARISKASEEKVTTLTHRIYQGLNMKGFSRMEYMLRNGVPYLLDVNTVPGLTEQSIFPKQLDAAGISMRAFISAELQRITR